MADDGPPGSPSAASILEQPVALDDLVDPRSYDDIARQFHLHLGVNLRLHDPRSGSWVAPGAPRCPAETGDAPRACGTRALCDCGARFSLRDLAVGGDVIGRAVAGPFRDGAGDERAPTAAPVAARSAVEQTLGLVAAALEGLLRAELARQLTNRVHTASSELSFHELAEKNAALSASMAKLQRMDAARAAFLQTMSHELRTPLTSIIGYTDMLLEGIGGEVSPEQSEYLRTIQGKSDQLMTLIAQLLDLARLETGDVSLHATPTHLGRLADAAIEQYRSRAEREQVRLQVEHVGEIPELRLDPVLLRQALLHLVANALKFTAAGGEILVLIEPGQHPGRARRAGPFAPAPEPAIRLSVRDNGIGIEPEHLDRIFEPFFQSDNSSTREYGGAGIGLAIAQAYVEAHGGEIWAENHPEGGALVTITIPIARHRDDPPLAALDP